VLALALALGPQRGLVLAAVQTLVYAISAILGMRFNPYLSLFRAKVAPRLSTPTRLTSERPLQIAQGIGMLACVVGLLAGLLGASVGFYVFVGAATLAAAVHAATGLCVGCRVFDRVGELGGHADLTDASARRRREHDVAVG
jgi:hypothetical protein